MSNTKVPGAACSGTDLLNLDPRGDVILAIHKSDGTPVCRARCCSRVLELSSFFFSIMFNSDMKEGVKFREQDCPILDFKEEHPHGMLKLLAVLHHHGEDFPLSLSFDMISAVAMETDKFDCAAALQYWSEVQCSTLLREHYNKIVSVDQVGNLMTAACMFQLRDPYPYLGVAVRNLPQSAFGVIWKHKALKHIPDVIAYWMSNRIAELISLFQTAIYSVEVQLQNDQDKALVMDGAREYLCTDCEGSYPKTAASCSTPGCRHRRRMSRICGPDSRRAKYHELLTKHNFWPSAAGFRLKSLFEILQIVTLLENDHKCCGFGKCPLTKQLELLPTTLMAVLNKSPVRRDLVRSSLPSVPKP